MKIQVGTYSGIGSRATTPIPKVDVNGTIELSGTITLNNISLPTSDGTNQQALTTNGHGVLSWADINMNNRPFSCSTLTATGTVTFDGLIYPASDGTNHQILKTDGHGNLSWVNTYDVFNNVAVPATTLTANSTVSLRGFTYPSSDGTTGQGLITDGSKHLSWATLIPTRTVVSLTTPAIDNLNTYEGTITGYLTYGLMQITVDNAAWVRIYSDTAGQIDDRSRSTLDGNGNLPIYTEALSGDGVVAEFMTTQADTLVVTPMIPGFNDDPTPTSNIIISITNMSGANSTITTNLTIIRL